MHTQVNRNKTDKLEQLACIEQIAMSSRTNNTPPSGLSPQLTSALYAHKHKYIQQLLCQTTTTTTRRRNVCTRPHTGTRGSTEQRETAYRAGLFHSAVIKLEKKTQPHTLINTQQTQINPKSLQAALILMRSERYTASPFRGELLQRTILIVITGIRSEFTQLQRGPL